MQHLDLTSVKGARLVVDDAERADLEAVLLQWPPGVEAHGSFTTSGLLAKRMSRRASRMTIT